MIYSGKLFIAFFNYIILPKTHFYHFQWWIL